VNQRIENILESITDAFVAVDHEWRYTYMNERALRRMQGRKREELPREEFLGKNMWEVFPEAVGTTIYEKYHEAMREHKSVEFETYFSFSDEWIEAHAYPSEDGLAIYYRDITERKRAEAEQQRLADIVQNSSDFIGICDLDWMVIFLNDAGQRMVGLNGIEEVRRSRVPDYFAPKDLASVGEEMFATVLEEGRWVGELNLRHFETGEPIPVLWDVFRLDDPRTGEPANFATITRDISERKREQKGIETRVRQQAAVADLGLRALAGDDLQLLMDEAVACIAEILGVENSEVVEILPGGDELRLWAGVGWEEGLVGRATVKAGFESQVGYALLVNEPLIVEDLATETRFRPPPVLHEHGLVSGMSVVIHGRYGPVGVLGAYTRSRRFFSEDDANFMQAVANVLATAIERQGAQERVEEGREAERSRLARDLHDEPLQDLADALVQLQQIQSFSEDPQQTQRLARLLATLDRIGPQLRGAIYDLRLQGEHDRLFPELLEALVELHREMAPDSEIAYEVHDGVLSGPLGERGRQLLRMLGEALTNVRRHSGASQVRVGVGITEEKLWAEVEDDGRGFDATQQEDDFEQALSVTGGMGLRGMRERARALGGDLKIESDQESGTRVRFEMTLKKDVEEAEDEGAVRVLLVDDHTAIREALAPTFEGEGFEVAGQAGSMAEARRMLEERQHPIDVAVIDLGLPDGYGAELIKELRQNNPQAQALVLSANLDRANIARAVQLGAAGVLSKTAHLEEVAEAVRRLRAGETLMPLEEVVAMLRFAGSEREQEYEASQAIEKLTPREIEVLQALALGLDSEGIADKLNIALRTERNHMASILKKLGLHSQLQALVFALRYGVAEVP
jgi:PAS domain S-box-containing protein